MFKYIKIFKLWKEVKKNMSVPGWYRSKVFLDSLIAFGAKCLSAFFEVELQQSVLDKFSNNLFENITIVLSTLEEVKKNKEKRVELDEDDFNDIDFTVRM